MLPSPALPAVAVPAPAAAAAPPQAAAQPQPSSAPQPQDSGAAAELDRRAAELDRKGAELERKAAELEAARREAASAREAVAHEVAIMRRQLDTAQAAAAEAEKVGGREGWLCSEAVPRDLLWPWLCCGLGLRPGQRVLQHAETTGQNTVFPHPGSHLQAAEEARAALEAEQAKSMRLEVEVAEARQELVSA